MSPRGGKTNRRRKAQRPPVGGETGAAQRSEAAPPIPGGPPPGPIEALRRAASTADTPGEIAESDRRELSHNLWIHPALCDTLRSRDPLYKRLGIVLEQLAAHGRTAVVKSAGEENRGWLRSPLGGNGGQQYYLWWAHEGTVRTRHLDAPQGAIIVRAARHHDEHGVLEAGSDDDYLRLTHGGDIGKDIAGRPWTDEQDRFVRSSNTVRLVHGRPGSGKTTALWRAVEARTNERVLYVTWSKALSKAADEHFACFAPESVAVRTVDYLTLVSEILARDVERIPLQTSMDRFEDEIEKLNLDIPPPWTQNHEGLFSEIRSTLLGDGIYAKAGQNGEADFDEERYLRHGAARGYDSRAIRTVIKVAHKMGFAGLDHVFPEMVAAAQAAATTADGNVPESLLGYDRIVIDEAQDLTLIETIVLGELWTRTAEQGERRPKLLIAADAGQTVRPTNFSWGQMAKVVTKMVGRSESFALDGHVRCPAKIAEVIDHATERYRRLNKELRPEKQTRQERADHVDAQLLYAQSTVSKDGARLVEKLADAERVALLALGEIPEWVPAKLRASVMNAEQCKGLEYQAVVILNPGYDIEMIDTWAGDEDIEPEQEQLMRTWIDQLRVGLSRATETLALVEIDSEPELEDASRRLLGQAAVPCSVDEMIDHLTKEDVDNEERVLGKTLEASRSYESAPARAWRAAEQALRLLGNPERPNGVANRHIREETRLTVLDIAARLLTRSERIEELDLRKQDIIDTAMAAVGLDIPGTTVTAEKDAAVAEVSMVTEDDPETEKPREVDKTLRREIETIARLSNWEENEARKCLILETAAGLEEKFGSRRNWLRETIKENAQSLLKSMEAGTESVFVASVYETTIIERWLRQLGQTGGVEKKARALARDAFDTIASELRETPHGNNAGMLREQLGEILKSIGKDPVRQGRVAEIDGKTDTAIELYRNNGADDDAVRLLRTEAKWKDAAKLATGGEKKLVDWLRKLEALAAAPPDGADTLFPAEATELQRIGSRVQKLGSRHRRG